VTADWDPSVRSLIKDGSANVSPVWFRWRDDAFEVVIARGDVKLKHLNRDPRCALPVFEAVPRFRGIEVRGVPELVEGDVTEARKDIADRYLGADHGPMLLGMEANGSVVVVNRRAWSGDQRLATGGRPG
jgi:hypothetical protein